MFKLSNSSVAAAFLQAASILGPEGFSGEVIV